MSEGKNEKRRSEKFGFVLPGYNDIADIDVINSNFENIDTNIYSTEEIQEKMSEKQNKLITGHNIEIDDNNVINVVGDGTVLMNYDEAVNKPSINGVQLSANKTPGELGLVSKNEFDSDWEDVSDKIQVSPNANIKNVELLSAFYKNGLLSVCLRSTMSTALTEGSAFKININPDVELFQIVGMSGVSNYLGRTVVSGNCSQSGIITCVFSGANWGADAVCFLPLQIPVNKIG